MKKWIVSFLVVLIVATFAYAKNAVIEIEYTFDSQFEPFVTEFRLYVEEIGGTEMTLLATQTLISARVWNTPTIDLPPGKMMNYYLAAVYEDGGEMYSPAYQFALRGKPTVGKITRKQ